MTTNKRNTVQRAKILQYLRGVKTHPAAEAVYIDIKKELPQISLGTVYRNLNLLAQQGEILKLESGKEARFDGNIFHHQHCVCSSCGRIIDVFHNDMSEYAMRHVKSNQFKPDSVRIVFTGLCRECGGRKK